MAAASLVQSHLKVEGTKDSSVIYVTFQHENPELVQPVLGEIITDYLKKHEQVHKSIGISDEVLQDRITQLRLEIAQTDDELRMAKTNAGIIDIAESKKALQDESSRINRELRQARASQFERQTSMKALASAGAKAGVTNLFATVPTDKLARYKAVCKRLTYLENRQNDFMQQGYTDQNKLVQENRDQMVRAAKDKVEMETQYPLLVEMDSTESGPGASTTGASLPPAVESVQATSLPLRIKVLEEQWSEIRGEFDKLNDAETKIADLERRKKVQEENFNFWTTMQEQSHIDQSLGPDRVSNIRQIQNPSPPGKDFRKFYKTIALIIFGGLFAGLAWAFLIEFYLDRSIKRPVDLQTKLRIPVFLSIPDLNHNSHRRLAAPERKQLEFAGGKNSGDSAVATNGALEIATPVNDALQSHYDALRDRLVSYFESINLTRKPKLVAITSTSKGAGVSTISAGLAASLSETGDGRVLLVDMNRENGAAQQFVRGEECKLDDALISEKRDQALVQENLYVVSEGNNVDNLPRVLPKRFASLVPKLKASDYDYIIFDMPPVSQTSITTRLAGFMDTVMLVVESEKTDRDVVAQANQLLEQSKANVTAVLNKTRNYVPARLSHDIHADM